MCVGCIEKFSHLVPGQCDQLHLRLKLVCLNCTMDLVGPGLSSGAAVLHLWHPGACTRG